MKEIILWIGIACMGIAVLTATVGVFYCGLFWQHQPNWFCDNPFRTGAILLVILVVGATLVATHLF